jgi:hypothetical protein
VPSAPRIPSLAHLKKQAKDLLRAVRAADPQALSRVAARLPQSATRSIIGTAGREVRLSHALLVIAREHGFASWPKLKAYALVASEQAASEPDAARQESTTRPLPPSRVHDRAARARALAALARELADRVARGDASGLAARFASLPRRDILAVRALLVAGGDHPILADVLLEGLSSASARVRYDCAHALDHFADERCVVPLRRLLDDPVPRVRRMALHVLSCDACKLHPLPEDDDLVALVIDRALADPSINVRRHATVALGGCHRDARADRVLEALAGEATDAAIRREARQALRRRGACAT